MKHALLSPSASHRWLVCPGSVEANRNKPHTTNVYAQLGTSAHGLLEMCLRLGSNPYEFEGKTLEAGHDAVTPEMCDAVAYAIEYVHNYREKHPKAKLLIEHRVDYGQSIGAAVVTPGLPDASFAFGTSDIILDNWPVEAVAVDYKHGTGNPVSVKDNSQLLLYLVGQRQARGKYQRYRSVIVQPRLPRRKPVQEAPAITDQQLMTWVRKVVMPVVPIALSPDAPRVAGKHCRYCEAEKTCPEKYKIKQASASKDFKAE